MIGKIALLAVALMLLSATVAVAGPRMTELDNYPTPSDAMLSAVPLYDSSSVWPGTFGNQDTRDRPQQF